MEVGNIFHRLKTVERSINDLQEREWDGSLFEDYSTESALCSSFPSQSVGDLVETNLKYSGSRKGIGTSGIFTRLLLSASIGTISKPYGTLRGSGL